jgi:hypothetical protein
VCVSYGGVRRAPGAHVDPVPPPQTLNTCAPACCCHPRLPPQLVACNSPAGRLGLSVCYDLRFPEVRGDAAAAPCTQRSARQLAWRGGGGVKVTSRLSVASCGVRLPRHAALPLAGVPGPHMGPGRAGAAGAISIHKGHRCVCVWLCVCVCVCVCGGRLWLLLVLQLGLRSDVAKPGVLSRACSATRLVPCC